MLGTWALANGLGALLGAIISAAHPLTLVLAFFSAPFAALHPVIAVGWLCALLECWLRKPEVQDFELLSEDLSTIKGWWKNRISHIFLVLILANLGSVIGTVVGITLGSLGISLL